MSEEIVAALHPPRLPESFTQTGVADYLLALGLGLLLAVLVLALLSPVLKGRRPKALPFKKAVQRAQALRPHEALPQLAALAQQSGLPLSEEEREALYLAPNAQAVQSLSQRLLAKGGRK